MVYWATRIRGLKPLRPACGCVKLLARDWEWPDEIQEEREATQRRERFLRGERLPIESVPEDGPPTGSWNVAWDLLATFKGSLSEKHLDRYLDEHAFHANRKPHTVASRFEVVARTFAAMDPVPYRAITARPAPEGHPVSIVRVPIKARR